MTTMICRFSALLPAVAAAALASTAWAGGLPITPGLWEMNTQATVFGKTDGQVEQRCIEEDSIDPVALVQKAEGCSVDNATVDGSTLSFDQSCAAENGEVAGHFTFTIEGDEGSGTGEMTMTMGGVEMPVSYATVMTRVGDC